MSGRSRPSSVPTLSCSTKSQWASMPAISTTRRSWISPQRPRTAGAFSAWTRLLVSCCSFSWATGERCDLLAQRAVGLGAGLLEAADVLLEAAEGVADRRHQPLDRLPALVEVPLGGGLETRPGSRRPARPAGG